MFPNHIIDNEHLVCGTLSPGSMPDRYMDGYLTIHLDLIWGTLVEGLPLGLRLLSVARGH